MKRAAASIWWLASSARPSAPAASAGSSIAANRSERPKPWKSRPHTGKPAAQSASAQEWPSKRCAIEVADGNVAPCTSENRGARGACRVRRLQIAQEQPQPRRRAGYVDVLALGIVLASSRCHLLVGKAGAGAPLTSRPNASAARRSVLAGRSGSWEACARGRRFPAMSKSISSTVSLGSGEYRYEPVENWAKLPPGWSFKEVGAVGVDADDNVYVFNRGEHPMMVFDRDGNFLRSWGEGVFPRAHGMHVAPDGTLWLTDDGDHSVRQCTLDGKVLLTFGVPGKPAPFMSGEPFHRCTHTALAPNGRHLRLRRLRQRARAQVLAGRQAADVVGRPGHRSRRVQHRPQHHLRRATAGCTSPTARTIASRCSTATGDTRRSGTICTGRAACSCRRANARCATSASSGRDAGQPRHAQSRAAADPSWTTPASASRASAGCMRAWSGTIPRAARDRVDTRGDIYVGEVSWTNWTTDVPGDAATGRDPVVAQVP